MREKVAENIEKLCGGGASETKIYNYSIESGVRKLPGRQPLLKNLRSSLYFIFLNLFSSFDSFEKNLMSDFSVSRWWSLCPGFYPSLIIPQKSVSFFGWFLCFVWLVRICGWRLSNFFSFIYIFLPLEIRIVAVG